MSPALGEFIGTALLLILGNGVVASTLLAQSKAHDAGWMAISSGWAFGVFGAVLTVGSVSGAHINRARDLGPLNRGPLAADTYAAVGRF